MVINELIFKNLSCLNGSESHIGHRGFLITLRNVENLRRHIGKNASFNNGYEQKDKRWWSKRLLI